MLQGSLLFVEKNRITGESAKGKYDFTNLILSDGFQSVEFATDRTLAENLTSIEFKKGDKVLVTVDFKRGRFVATDIKKVA